MEKRKQSNGKQRVIEENEPQLTKQPLPANNIRRNEICNPCGINPHK